MATVTISNVEGKAFQEAINQPANWPVSLGLNSAQLGYLQRAILAGFGALQIDENGSHGETFTVAATLTDNSFSLTISP
jgi:hypothetical protein